MKFQNPSFNIFFERTDKRTSRKQYAPHLFKVGGITKQQIIISKIRKNCQLKSSYVASRARALAASSQEHLCTKVTPSLHLKYEPRCEKTGLQGF